MSLKGTFKDERFPVSRMEMKVYRIDQCFAKIARMADIYAEPAIIEIAAAQRLAEAIKHSAAKMK